MEGLVQDASMELAPAAGPMDHQLTVQQVSNAMAGPVAAAAGKQDGPATSCHGCRSSRRSACIPTSPLLPRCCNIPVGITRISTQLSMGIVDLILLDHNCVRAMCDAERRWLSTAADAAQQPGDHLRSATWHHD